MKIPTVCNWHDIEMLQITQLLSNILTKREKQVTQLAIMGKGPYCFTWAFSSTFCLKKRTTSTQVQGEQSYHMIHVWPSPCGNHLLDLTVLQKEDSQERLQVPSLCCGCTVWNFLFRLFCFPIAHFYISTVTLHML